MSAKEPKFDKSSSLSFRKDVYAMKNEWRRCTGALTWTRLTTTTVFNFIVADFFFSRGKWGNKNIIVDDFLWEQRDPASQQVLKLSFLRWIRRNRLNYVWNRFLLTTKFKKWKKSFIQLRAVAASKNRIRHYQLVIDRFKHDHRLQTNEHSFMKFKWDSTDYKYKRWVSLGLDRRF